MLGPDGGVEVEELGQEVSEHKDLWTEPQVQCGVFC